MARNREQWLEALASRAARRIASALPDGGDEEPAIRISCGFTPSGKGRKRQQADILPPALSDDFTAEIFISPEISDTRQVARLLLPLLVQAHAGVYKQNASVNRCVQNLRLNAEVLPDWLEREIATLGEYPHAAVSLEARPKQTTRLVKVACLNTDHDPYVVRMSRTTIASALPLCGICTSRMAVAE